MVYSVALQLNNIISVEPCYLFITVILMYFISYCSHLQVENGHDLEFSSISVSMQVDHHGKPVNSSEAFELVKKTGDDSSTELLLSDSMRYRVFSFFSF